MSDPKAGWEAIAQRTTRFGKSSTAEDVTFGLDLRGKTAVVTGCNTGIGFETMRVLALRGAHVLGIARSKEKADRACTAVNETEVFGKATPFVCDLEHFDAVAGCADRISAMGVAIDILICSAGIVLFHHEQINGIEKQLTVNHLSHFILVNRLLDRIKSADQGRIVMVSSSFAYLRAPRQGIDFTNLAGLPDHAGDPHLMYGQSKLANALVATELARRFASSSVTANALHPGYVRTDIARGQTSSPPRKASQRLFRTLQRKAMLLMSPIKDVAQGAATSCYVATCPALAQVSGRFFEDCRPLSRPRGHIYDDALAARLWRESEKLTRGYLM